MYELRSYLDQNLACLATDGCLVIIGVMGGVDAKLPLRQIMVKRQRIIGSTLRARPIASKAKVMELLCSQVWPNIENGRISPILHEIYPIQEIESAHPPGSRHQ